MDKKSRFLILILTIIMASVAQAVWAAANNTGITITEDSCPEEDDLYCFRARGWSKGNHEIDCTVIIPDSGRNARLAIYPLIAWANGWEQGDRLGQCTTNGYLPGLKEWARDGYVIAAANQWSVQESDLLACVEWVLDSGEAPIDGENVGLVGHSQGAGAAVKAGDGNKRLPPITAVMAMNPYGPGWVNPEDQDGPVFIVGGALDTTTPPTSYQAVWDAIKAQKEPGGINAVLADGTHNSDAWGTDPATGEVLSCDEASKVDFGRYQHVGLLWWEIQLKGKRHCKALESMLDNAPWTDGTEYASFSCGRK